MTSIGSNYQDKEIMFRNRAVYFLARGLDCQAMAHSWVAWILACNIFSKRLYKNRLGETLDEILTISSGAYIFI